MFEWPTLPEWIWWGFALVAILPIATVVLNELGLNLDRQDRNDLARPVALLRNTCLPLLFLVLLLRMVAGLESSNLLVRIADTVFWITVINAGLLFFNLIFFSGDQEESWRHKTPKLFVDLLRLFLVAIGAAVAISKIWGIDLGGLLTALGVGSIVIGLALQDTLGSLFSGIALLSARHYKEGDWLEVGGHEGVVMSMNWRSISLRTRSGDIVVLPNTDLAKQHVRNIAAVNGWHSELVDVYLAYDHPPETVLEILAEAARATPGVSRAMTSDSRIKHYGDNAICYQARIFMDDYGRAPVIKSEFQSLFWYRAQRAGLVFPAAHNRMYRIPEGPHSQAADTKTDRARLVSQSGAIDRSPAILEPLVEHARVDRYGKGEVLIQSGKVANTVLIVIAGTARAIYRDGDDARDIEFHEFGPGQIIVFKSMLRHDRSRFDVCSQSGMRVVAVPVDDMVSFLSDNVELAREIEEMISQRENVADQRIRHERPELSNGNLLDDRAKIIQDMFRS